MSSHRGHGALQTKALKALLVGENSHAPSIIANCLKERGFQCEYARSGQQALSLARIHDFELVLSRVRLGATSLLSLMDMFVGSAVTLFYFQGVENGCWWLPAIQRGKQCFGSSAYRSDEFVPAPEAAIGEVS